MLPEAILVQLEVEVLFFIKSKSPLAISASHLADILISPDRPNSSANQRTARASLSAWQITLFQNSLSG